ncbi:MAG TPA: methylated-DNA--[protein]-cysteine S-methyltransferase [Solirubrobacteraceae bacterium]|nr:methylated-DNA--[protein]-cysteine S-methyltransferase [Solirubrobacteraceae bacterium]
MTQNWSSYESPFGRLTLIGSEAGLRELHFPGRAPALDRVDRDDGAFREVRGQLEEYFAGERKAFDLALDVSGTELQRRVWRALQALPFGSVTTYGELARELGVPDSPRRTGTGERTVSAPQKVGWAIGSTPTPIVIPCHRVVGADGSLTGYRGGLRRKRALLDFEAALVGRAGFWTHQGQLSLL